MRFILALFLVFCNFNLAFADVNRVVETITSTDSLTSIAVPTTTTVFTKSFSLVNHLFEPVGVMYKATSSGTVAMTIQAEQTYIKPTTEAVANSTFVLWEASEVIADQQWHMITLDTVTMPYARFRIVGTGSNADSTTIQIKVSK